MEKEFSSISVTPEKANEIIAFYLDYQRLNNGPYIIFQDSYSGLTITVYQNKKGKQKVVFAGPDALKEAKKWDETVEKKEKEVQPVGWLCKENQIGSDEVGVGDFLLPVTVVAAFVRGKDLKTLAEFGTCNNSSYVLQTFSKPSSCLKTLFF